MVVGGQVQDSRLSVQEEGCCTTDFVKWYRGVNGQLEQRVRVACILFMNERPFLVKSLDVELFVGG